MSKTGELTEEHLKDLSQDPACEFFVTEFQQKLADFKDLADLLKTPKMKRQEAGIDVHLISQVKTSAENVAARRKTSQQTKSYKADHKAYSEGGVRGDESTRL